MSKGNEVLSVGGEQLFHVCMPSHMPRLIAKMVKNVFTHLNQHVICAWPSNEHWLPVPPAHWFPPT